MVKNIRQKRKIFKEQGRFCCGSGLVAKVRRRGAARAMVPPSAVLFQTVKRGRGERGLLLCRLLLLPLPYRIIAKFMGAIVCGIRKMLNFA